MPGTVAKARWRRRCRTSSHRLARRRVVSASRRSLPPATGNFSTFIHVGRVKRRSTATSLCRTQHDLWVDRTSHRSSVRSHARACALLRALRTHAARIGLCGLAAQFFESAQSAVPIFAAPTSPKPYRGVRLNCVTGLPHEGILFFSIVNDVRHQSATC